MKKVMLITILFISSHSHSGAATGGATEVTQILNNLQLIEQVMTTKEQLDVMISELKRLKNFVNSGEDLKGILLQLRYIIRYGQALAYNADNLSEEFNNRYQDFNYFLEQQTQTSGQYQTLAANERYQNWSRENLDSVHSALRAANLQSKYFQSEAQTIAEIERKSQTAAGRDALLQAAIEIAALQAKQLLQLRQLIASDMQMQANYQASLIDRQAEEDAIKAKALEKYDGKDKNPAGYNRRWQ